MNEAPNIVTDYNSDAAIDLGHEKNFHNHGFCSLLIIIGSLRDLIWKFTKILLGQNFFLHLCGG